MQYPSFPCLESKNNEGYLSKAFGALVFVLIVKWLWPWAIPFELFAFWHLNGTLSEVLASSWPVFAWGIGVTVIVALATRNSPMVNRNAEVLLVGGGILSLIAGVLEEMSFRWILFYSAIVGAQVVDWLLLGFLGIHVVQWMYLTIFGPIANFFTLGLLAPWLLSGPWFVGSAILTSNGEFRDGHSYLGIVGFINSWFIGMFMFYLMFSYGLYAAMIVHFLYDMFLYGVRYIDAAVERQLGWI